MKKSMPKTPMMMRKMQMDKEAVAKKVVIKKKGKK
jgi:hypothetical protein